MWIKDRMENEVMKQFCIKSHCDCDVENITNKSTSTFKEQGIVKNSKILCRNETIGKFNFKRIFIAIEQLILLFCYQYIELTLIICDENESSLV